MRTNLLKLLVCVAVVSIPLFLPAGDQRHLYEQTREPLTDRLLRWIAQQPGFDALETIDLVVLEEARMLDPDRVDPRLRDRLNGRFAAFGDEHGKQLRWVGVQRVPPPLSLTFRQLDGKARLVSMWRPPGQVVLRATLDHPYYRPIALLPPLLAIALALTFRQTLLALFAGVWVGATLVPWFQSEMTIVVTTFAAAGDAGAAAAAAGVVSEPVSDMPGATSFPNPLVGLWRFIRHYFWEQSVLDTFRIEIIGFVAVLIAAVGVMTRAGAIAGMVAVIVRFARTVRTTRLATVLMGFVIFFDDYTNSIIVGNTMRPLTDRMKISREKLAYLVDSTAAPVAGIMVLSTWVAYEVSQFAPQLGALGIDRDPYSIFIATIPFRFYSLFTLFFVFATVLLRRDFGPMLTAERRAATTGQLIRPGGKPLVAARITNMQPREGAPERWLNAVIPLAVVIGVTFVEIIRLGASAIDGPVDLLDSTSLRAVLGATDTVTALFRGSIAGWLVAVGLVLGQRILSFRECIVASIRGAGGVVFALAILFLAWSIGSVCDDLGTAHVLNALLKDNISPLVLPVVLFLLSCAVSFSTGSSWSTMAIILPNTVLLAYTVGEGYVAGPLALTIISIGAVLEGSIFGDHCSPLSDTTILSSVASASDHIDHVRTQMPYAIVTMLAAILIGYLPAVRGLHPAWSLIAGAAALVVLLLLIGRNPDRDRTVGDEPG